MITVYFDTLTDSEKESFCKGFRMADDIGVNDWDTATPWGAPWFWATYMNSESLDPEKWGKEWFEYCRADILDLP